MNKFPPFRLMYFDKKTKGLSTKVIFEAEQGQDPNFVIYLPKGNNNFIVKSEFEKKNNNQDISLYTLNCNEKGYEYCDIDETISFPIDKISRKNSNCDADNIFNIYYIFNKFSSLKNYNFPLQNSSININKIFGNMDGGFIENDECLYKSLLSRFNLENKEREFLDKNIFFYLNNYKGTYFYYIRLEFSKNLLRETTVRITKIIRISRKIYGYMKDRLTGYSKYFKKNNEKNIQEKLAKILTQSKLYDYRNFSFQSPQYLNFSKKNEGCKIQKSTT